MPTSNDNRQPQRQQQRQPAQQRQQSQPQRQQGCDRNHEAPRCNDPKCYLPDPWVVLRGDLDNNMAVYGSLLGQGSKPATDPEVDRFVMTCYQHCWHKPALLEANRDSLLLAFAEAAVVRLNLNPTAKECYIEVRDKLARFATQYQGLIVLMHRGNDIDFIHVDVVRRGDNFLQVGGSDPRIEHVSAGLEDSPEGYDNDDAILASYAVVKVRGSSRAIHEVARRANFMKARKMSTGPAWNSWLDRMAMKVPLRRLANRLPGADQVRQVLSVEDGQARGQSITLERVAEVFGDKIESIASARGESTPALAKQSDDPLQAILEASGSPSGRKPEPAAESSR